MPVLPAFCDNCGAAFNSGFAVDDCLNISFHNNKSGPCPRCGSMGTVLEGVFNVVNGAIEILSAPQSSIDSLNKLDAILKEAAVDKSTADDIATKIDSNVPELSEISKFIPKTSTELVAWLTFILIAIQTINQLGEDEKPDTTIIFNQSIEQSIEQKNYYPFQQPVAPPSRNSPCPCGSGKRYKQCCGNVI